MTGPMQVNGRGDLSFDQRLASDRIRLPQAADDLCAAVDRIIALRLIQGP